MKKLYKIFCLTFFAMFIASNVDASHMMGADVSYICISPGKYKIVLKAYRDCRGIPISASPAAKVFCGSLSYPMALTRTNIADITPVCGLGTAPCSPSNTTTGNEGIEEHTYEVIVDFNSSPYSDFMANNCCQVYFSIEECCRNGALNTLSPGNLFTEAMLDICKVAKDKNNKCNTSPQLSIPPVAYLCCNQPFTFNNGARELLDGDSLSYKLANALNAHNSNETYTGAYSAQYPMSPYCPPNPGTVNCKPVPNAKPPRGFYFDPETGDIIFTPTKCDEVAVIVIQIDEYRKDSTGKWQLIGQTRRDMQLVVKVCGNNNPPQIAGPNGKNKFSVCEGNKLCFTIDSKDEQFLPDQLRADTTYLTWNSGIPGATFRIVNPAVRERQAEFCWQTKIGDGRDAAYSFAVTAKDDNCPRPAISVKGFNIAVLRRARDIRKYDILNCGWLRFKADPIDTVNFKPNQYTYTWEVRDSLNQGLPQFRSFKQTDSLKFKKGGKYIITHVVNNPVGCLTQYQDTIIMPPVLDVELAFGKDTFVCQGDSFKLKPIVAYGYMPYKFKWESPVGTFNAKDTLDHFSIKPTGDVQIKLTLTDKNKCVDADTIIVRHILNPIVNIGPDQRICTYESVQLDAQHNDSLRYLWAPTGDTTRKITINVAGKYSVKVFNYLNCFGKDTMALFVNDTVIALAGPDVSVCHNDTLKIKGQRKPKGFSRQFTWTDVGTGTAAASDSFLKVKLTNPNVDLSGNPTFKTYSLYLKVNQGGHVCEDYDTVLVTVNPLPTFVFAGLPPRCYDDGDIKLTERVAWARRKGQTNDPAVRYSHRKNWVTGGPYPAAQFYAYTKFITTVPAGFKDTICYDYTDSNKCYNKECKPVTINPNPDVEIRNGIFCQRAGLAHLDILRKKPFNTVGGIQTWRCISVPPGSGLDTNAVVYNQGTFSIPDFVLDPGTELETNRTGQYVLQYCFQNPSTSCKRCDTAIANVVPLPIIEFQPIPKQCINFPNLPLNRYVNLENGKWSAIAFGGNRDKTNATVANALNNSVLQDSIFNPRIAAGIYTLKFVHTESGCLVEDSLDVTVNGLPQIIISAPDTVCSSDAPVDLVSNYAQGPNAKWSGFGVNGYQFRPDSSLKTKQYEGPHKLKYAYTNAATGCTNTDSLYIRVQSQPEVTITNSPKPMQQCEKTDFAITATSKWATAILWTSTGDGTFTNNTLNTTYKHGTVDTTIGTVTMTIATVQEGVCPAVNDKIDLIIHSYPQFDFVGDPLEGCEPLDVNLNSTVRKPTNGNLSYAWNIESKPLNTDPSPQGVRFDTAYEKGYDVKLVVTNSFPGGQCVDSIVKPAYIHVYPNPKADFISDPESFTTIALPKFQFTNKSTVKFGSMTYLWQFGTDEDDDTSTKKDPLYVYPEDTLKYYVSLTVTTDHNCTDVITQLRIIGPDVTVFIPNVFSPDGAGIAKNNVFRAIVNGEKSFFIQIYNRWGELMFETDDKYHGWDGTYKSTVAQQDVYMYTAKVTAYDGKEYQYDGTVTLLR